VPSNKQDDSQPSLDDEFIAGASIAEPSFSSRKRAARTRKFKRAFGKPFRFLRRNWKSTTILAIGIPVVVAVGVARWDGARTGSNTAQVLSETIDSTIAPTTSSTLVLDGRSYQKGDCVTWNQDISKSAEKHTSVVPCTSEHLFQYVSTFELHQVGDYPTDDRWDAIVKDNCTQPIKDFLGYDLDPHGRFSASSLQPTEDGWKQFDRTVKCGILVHDGTEQPGQWQLPSFTGDVRGADQTFLLPVGCYSSIEGQGDNNWKVDCGQPHEYEVVGTTTVKTKTRPSTNSAWHSATSDCGGVAKNYAGGMPKNGLQASGFPVEQSSWDAGRRTTECALTKFDSAGNVVKVAGSARAGAAA
jgi:hypothetical protein